MNTNNSNNNLNLNESSDNKSTTNTNTTITEATVTNTQTNQYSINETTDRLNLLKIKYHYDNLDNDQKLMKEIEDESKKPIIKRNKGIPLNGKLIIDSIPQCTLIPSEKDKISFLLKNPIFLLNDLKISKIDNLNIYKDNMKELYLQRNGISTIENLDFLENLEVLSLGNNYITKIQNLTQLKKLEILDLSNNLIDTLEHKNLPLSLHYLYLYDNPFFNTLTEYDVRYSCINYFPKLINIDSLEVTFRERHICSGSKINKKYINKGECMYIADHYRKEKEKRGLITERKTLFEQKFNIIHSKEPITEKDKKLNIVNKEITKNEDNRLNTIKNEDIEKFETFEIKDNDKFKDEVELKKQKIKKNIIDRSNEYIATSGKRMQGILSTIDVVRNRMKEFSVSSDETLDAMKENIKKSVKVDEFLEKMDNKITSYNNQIMKVIQEENNEQESDHNLTINSNTSNNNLAKSTIRSTASIPGINALKDFSQSFTKNKGGEWELKNQNFNDLKEFSKNLSESRNESILDESRLESKVDDNESRMESESVSVYRQGRNQLLSETTQSIQSLHSLRDLKDLKDKDEFRELNELNNQIDNL